MKCVHWKSNLLHIRVWISILSYRMTCSRVLQVLAEVPIILKAFYKDVEQSNRVVNVNPKTLSYPTKIYSNTTYTSNMWCLSKSAQVLPHTLTTSAEVRLKGQTQEYLLLQSKWNGASPCNDACPKYLNLPSGCMPFGMSVNPELDWVLYVLKWSMIRLYGIWDWFSRSDCRYRQDEKFKGIFRNLEQCFEVELVYRWQLQ